MLDAHLKPGCMLETPKAPSASQATIFGDEEADASEMGNQQATLAELGWLAGIIDGEGYVGLQTQNSNHGNRETYYLAALQITNCDEAIILKTREILRKLGVNPYCRIYVYGVKSRPASRVQYTLVVRRLAKVARALEPVLPYLTGVKAERSKLVHEFCVSRLGTHVPGSHKPNPYTPRQLEIIAACQPMQKRGASETTREAELERSVIWQEQKARGVVQL